MGSIAEINAEAQTTIPREIRPVLSVEPGDLIEWEVTGKDRAEVHRVPPVNIAYLRALRGTLGEWESKEDQEAYRDL